MVVVTDHDRPVHLGFGRHVGGLSEPHAVTHLEEAGQRPILDHLDARVDQHLDRVDQDDLAPGEAERVAPLGDQWSELVQAAAPAGEPILVVDLGAGLQQCDRHGRRLAQGRWHLLLQHDRADPS